MEKYPEEERCNPYKRYDGDPLSTYCMLLSISKFMPLTVWSMASTIKAKNALLERL